MGSSQKNSYLITTHYFTIYYYKVYVHIIFCIAKLHLDLCEIATESLILYISVHNTAVPHHNIV